MATVVITAAAQKQFLALPRAIQAHMERIFGRLERWPTVSGAKPLTGELAGSYRIRTGDYRIQFHVVSGDSTAGPSQSDRVVVDRVVVDKVGHRDGFYDA